MPPFLAAFDKSDKDKSGTLDLDELKFLLAKVDIEKDDMEVVEMLNAADKGALGGEGVRPATCDQSETACG